MRLLEDINLVVIFSILFLKDNIFIVNIFWNKVNEYISKNYKKMKKMKKISTLYTAEII